MDLTTLLARTTLTVTLLDGSTETVQVRQLPVNRLLDLLQATDDECAQVELYCDKPAGWSLTLTPDSFEQIVITGEKINSDFFARWLQRRRDRQERMFPGLADKITSAAISASPTSSPRSPSAAT